MSESYMDVEKSISGAIDRVFSMGKSTFYLILIFILGFVLRLIAAINLYDSADAMHFVTHAKNFLSAGRLVTYDQSSGLWFAFTSLIYKMFGMTQFASKFAALLFGAFSILVIYLLAREFFGEKVSLISAFLLAIAPFHISSTLAEMDVMALFFSLLGMLFFVRAVKNSKKMSYALSGLFFGLAIYTKVYPLLFMPSMLGYFVYHNWKDRKKMFSKKNITRILIFLGIAFLFCIPALTHNILLYQDKGFLDLQFTRVTGLGKNISEQYYGWDYQFGAKNSWAGLFLGDKTQVASGIPLLLAAIIDIGKLDLLNTLLGLFGILFIIFSRKEYKNYLVFFLLSIAFALPYLASIIYLPKHFIFLEILFIPMGALVVKNISEKLKGRGVKILFILLLLSSLILLGLPSSGEKHFYGKNHMTQVIDFKDENIKREELIVSDSRIYRGRTNWMFSDRGYLEASDFIQITNNQEQLTGEIVTVNVYYFECVIDDCGWGTIKDQLQLNQTMESFSAFFAKNGQLVKTFEEPDRNKAYYPIFSSDKKIEVMRVYEAAVNVKSSVLAIANQPKLWFLYSIGYEPEEKQFDYYIANGILGKTLDGIAHLIVWFAVILSFLSPLYVVYLTLKR